MTFGKLLLISSLVTIPLPCFANGGGYASGVSRNGNLSAGAERERFFVPVNLENVGMRTEDLRIDLHLEYAEVQVEYSLVNGDKPVSIQAGFPCVTLVDTENKAEPVPAVPAGYKNFSVRADGKPVAYQIKPGRELTEKEDEMFSARHVPTWYVFKMDFRAHETRKLWVSFRSPYWLSTEDVSDDETASPPRFSYLFSTAAIWRGPISQGHVVIRAVSVNPEEVKILAGKSDRFKRTAQNVWTWDFQNFKPTLADDLNIETRPEIFARSLYRQERDESVPAGEVFRRGDIWYSVPESTAAASSQLKGEDYAPNNVLTYDHTKCWAEGVPGNGEGEWIEFTLKDPVPLAQIGFINGLSKTEKLYYANNRIKTLEIKVDDGQPTKVELPDEYCSDEEYLVTLPENEAAAHKVRLTIVAVYPGTKYQDTCLSKVSLISRLKEKPNIQPAR